MRLRATGMTHQAIATELGVSRPAVTLLLRRGERRGPGPGRPKANAEKAVTLRSTLNTKRNATGIPIANAEKAVTIELRRGTWERFKNLTLERLAAEYEGLRGAVLRLPRGASLDDALGEKWGGKATSTRRAEDDPNRAYGRSDRMVTVIEAARGLLGLPARGTKVITQHETATFYCDDGSRRKVRIA